MFQVTWRIPRGELDANEGVVAIMQEIGKKANVEMYSEAEGDTTGQISVALYPTGAFTALNLTNCNTHTKCSRNK